MNSVAIILSSFAQPAGTERAVANLANLFAKENVKVYIISADTKSGTSPFELCQNVVVEHFGLKISNHNPFIKIISLVILRLRLSNLLKDKQIEVLIGTYSVLNCLLATFGSKVLTVGCEHFNYQSAGKLSRLLRKVFYPRLGKVVVLTEQDAQNYYFLLPQKMCVIPNSLSFSTSKKNSYGEKRVLAIGRLSKQKGFDILIDIAKKVIPQFPEWEFCIVGNGEDKSMLEELINKNKLNNNVKILAPRKDVISLYKSSSIYAMTSRFEGLPMVLIEAVSCGLPIISFDCPYGPASVVHDGIDGFLIENGNISEFAKKLSNLMKDEALRSKFGQQAYMFSERFSPDEVCKKWFNILKASLE